MADITTDENYPNVLLSIKNKLGQDAPVDGIPVWATSDETVLTVTPNETGMAALVDTVAPGTARVTAQADADLGEGVSNITCFSEDVNVSIGPNSVASVMQMSLGDPAPKANQPVVNPL